MRRANARDTHGSSRRLVKNGRIDLYVVVFVHQLAKKDPLIVASGLMRAVKTLALPSHLLGYRGMHIHAESKIEPTNRGAVHATMDPYGSAVLTDLEFETWMCHDENWKRMKCVSAS